MKKRTKVMIAAVMFAFLIYFFVPVVPLTIQGSTSCFSKASNPSDKACWTNYQYSSLSYKTICQGATIEWTSDVVHTSYSPYSTCNFFQ